MRDLCPYCDRTDIFFKKNKQTELCRYRNDKSEYQYNHFCEIKYPTPKNTVEKKSQKYRQNVLKFNSIKFY